MIDVLVALVLTTSIAQTPPADQAEPPDRSEVPSADPPPESDEPAADPPSGGGADEADADSGDQVCRRQHRVDEFGRQRSTKVCRPR